MNGRRFSDYVDEVLLNLRRNGNSVLGRLEFLERLGLPRAEIEKDIADLLDQRIFLWLLGEPRPDLNFAERRRLMVRRLETLLNDSTLDTEPNMSEVIDKLTECQAYVSLAVESQREGIGNTEESGFRDLLVRQGHRCAVCGVPVTTSKRLATEHFRDGYEPVVAPHLDHIIPFYFLGNSPHTEVLCEHCNLLKNERMGVHEDGWVLAGNHVRRRERAQIRRRMAFWTIYHRRKCDAPGCGIDARSSTLLVSEKNGRLFTYGNIQVRCLSHRDERSFWLHEK